MDLKDFMKKERFSYASLGELLGVHKSYVHRLANGERYASRDIAKKIEQISQGQVKVKDLINPTTRIKEKLLCPLCGQHIRRKKEYINKKDSSRN